MSDQLPAVPALEAPVISPTSNPSTHPYTIAAVIGGVVYQVVQTDGKGASIFLANPTFVQIPLGGAQVGDIYDATTGTFSTPTV